LTRSIVAGATPYAPASARDTTDFDTPARAATSWMVGTACRPLTSHAVGFGGSHPSR